MCEPWDIIIFNTMRILEEYDCSQEGNDCFIKELWLKVVVFGEVKVLHLQEVSGWSEQDLEVKVITFYRPEYPEKIKEWFQ